MWKYSLQVLYLCVSIIYCESLEWYCCTATAARPPTAYRLLQKHWKHHYPDTSCCLSKYPACHLCGGSPRVEQIMRKPYFTICSIHRAQCGVAPPDVSVTNSRLRLQNAWLDTTSQPRPGRRFTVTLRETTAVLRLCVAHCVSQWMRVSLCVRWRVSLRVYMITTISFISRASLFFSFAVQMRVWVGAGFKSSSAPVTSLHRQKWGCEFQPQEGDN